jgi:CheY-like chemotaxis protein
MHNGDLIKVDDLYSIDSSLQYCSNENNDPKHHSPARSLSKKQNQKNDRIPFILLVEDNAIALKTIESLARLSHCTYICAENGAAAFQLVKEHQFDLVITDLGLPDFSGLELTQKIRTWEKEANLSAMPIIGLSVHAMNDAALSVGMNDLLMKPLTLSDFHRLLSDYIDMSNP